MVTQPRLTALFAACATAVLSIALIGGARLPISATTPPAADKDVAVEQAREVPDDIGEHGRATRGRAVPAR